MIFTKDTLIKNRSTRRSNFKFTKQKKKKRKRWIPFHFNKQSNTFHAPYMIKGKSDRLKFVLILHIINPIIRPVYYKRFAESSSSRKAASQVFQAFFFPSSPKRVDETEIPDARADNRSRLRNPRITAHGNDIPVRRGFTALLGRDYRDPIHPLLLFSSRMDHAASPTFAKRLYKFNGIVADSMQQMGYFFVSEITR